MPSLPKNLRAIQFLFLISTVALASAYSAEYIFDLKPCHLCLWQRIPYAAILILSGIGFIFYKKPHLQKIIVLLGILALLVETGLAAYHVGVEHGVFAGLSGCSSGDVPDAGMSIEDIREQIYASDIIRCDQPAFMFLGLSMAGWNVVYSFLGVVGILLILRMKRKQP